MKKKINTGDDIKTSVGRWTFDGKVVTKFDSHIQKSIPLYDWCHEISINLSDFFLKNKSYSYDIGCSTGTFLQKLHKKHQGKKIKFYGIDEVNKMIITAKKKCQKNKNIFFLNNDFLNIKIKNSDLITSFFTLAFIDAQKRQKAFDKIYKSLNWGGATIIFDKVRAPDARFQDMMTTLYSEYKISAGYSAEEILAKNLSLKGVLDPFSSKANIEMLKRAGFKDIMIIFKFITFEGYLAIK